MGDWNINIPYRSRSQALDVEALSELPRAIENRDERRVVQTIMFNAVTSSEMRTVGDLLDHLNDLGQAGRRQLLNEARQAAGLPSAERIDAERAQELYRRAHAHLVERDESGFAFLVCADPDCRATPMNPVTGLPAPTQAKRWWCPQHLDQAAAGDMDRWERRMRFGPSGSFEVVDEEREEAEQRRQEREAESLRVKREHKAAERAVEAEEHRQHQAALVERDRSRGAGWE